MNVRDWLYVGDHCQAIRRVLESGRVGQTYNVGGNSERTNIDVVTTICRIVDDLAPGLAHGPCQGLIKYVPDRPGHDRRYSIDSAKLRGLGWERKWDFTEGLKQTVEWYAERRDWWEPIKSGEYLAFYREQYAERLGQ